VNLRDFTKDPQSKPSVVGDLGPEGRVFLPAADSPNGKPLPIVGNGVRGTTAVFGIDVLRLR
jgi:hypothetical protein